MLGRHPAQQWASGAVKFAVIAPVAAGVTADPGWMSAFARHVEACGFESIVAVEHTVLMTEYSSVYPYDASGRVELPADCPVPDPLDLLAFLAAQTDRLGETNRLNPFMKPGTGHQLQLGRVPNSPKGCALLRRVLGMNELLENVFDFIRAILNRVFKGFPQSHGNVFGTANDKLRVLLS